jgi:hypothetical protein
MTNINIENKIIDLLEEALIKPKDGLNSIYDRILMYYERSQKISGKPTEDDLKNLNEILPPNLLSKDDLVGGFSYLREEKLRTIAIDFPILISKLGENRKKIMVCALDSFPSNTGDYTNSIIAWAPFSLNYNWNLATRSSKQNIAFFSVLLESADLYVTDIFKIFYRRGLAGTDYRSNQDQNYTTVKLDMHKSILEQEIEIIKPDLILTLGNKSRDVIYSIIKAPIEKWSDDIMSGIWLDNKTPVISIPHISGAANGAKAKVLNNPKYENVKAKGNQKLAHILLGRMTQ